LTLPKQKSAKTEKRKAQHVECQWGKHRVKNSKVPQPKDDG